MDLARDEHVPAHPAILKLSQEKAIGHADAEALLRDQGRRGDKEAAQAIADYDAARQAKTDAVTKQNLAMAAEMGMSMDQIRELVAKFLANKTLYAWFISRFNWTHAHGRPLEHHE